MTMTLVLTVLAVAVFALWAVAVFASRLMRALLPPDSMTSLIPMHTPGYEQAQILSSRELCGKCGHWKLMDELEPDVFLGYVCKTHRQVA